MCCTDVPLFGLVHIALKQTSPTYSLPQRYVIFKENSFHFHGKNYPQTHGTAMGTKIAAFFANIFMVALFISSITVDIIIKMRK